MFMTTGQWEEYKGLHDAALGHGPLLRGRGLRSERCNNLLVLADWLEEHGHEDAALRALFFRTCVHQVRLLRYASSWRWYVQERERGPLGKNDRTWKFFVCPRGLTANIRETDRSGQWSAAPADFSWYRDNDRELPFWSSHSPGPELPAMTMRPWMKSQLAVLCACLLRSRDVRGLKLWRNAVLRPEGQTLMLGERNLWREPLKPPGYYADWGGCLGPGRRRHDQPTTSPVERELA